MYTRSFQFSIPFWDGYISSPLLWCICILQRIRFDKVCFNLSDLNNIVKFRLLGYQYKAINIINFVNHFLT